MTLKELFAFTVLMLPVFLVIAWVVNLITG